MSKLLVNEIAPKSGSTVTISGLSGGNNIKEQLAMLCDGGSYTVSSGTYTSQNVTSYFDQTATYQDLTGSVINYTPPSGSTCVIYDFQFNVAYLDAHGIGNFKFMIDGTEQTELKRSLAAGNYLEGSFNIRHVLPIGGTASTATGRQSSWTSPKELKILTRSSYDTNKLRIHSTYYWDGTGTNQFCKPNLVITALG